MIAGYTGPGGKTILPSKATAKLDFRLVPDQTAVDAEAKLKAHLAKRGFGDIEVKVSGGYDPTQTDENSSLIKASVATYRLDHVFIQLEFTKVSQGLTRNRIVIRGVGPSSDGYVGAWEKRSPP